MASIRKIDGKDGISYAITVTKGRDASGKQIRHYKTWKPPEKMTAKQTEKAVQKVAFEFEQSINLGYALDNRQTFQEYATYALEVKKREGLKNSTLERYQELLERINPAIGHLKLIDIRPQHLNRLYVELAKPGVSKSPKTAVALPAFLEITKQYTRKQLADLSGVSAMTISSAACGNNIQMSNAKAIATVLNMKFEKLFTPNDTDGVLSEKTILEHHRLIRTILAQAEKEMLVPYNAAAKASPPKARRTDVNYFNPDELTAIHAALEDAPLKWKVISNLLIFTGARRGEIMGLKWSDVDFQNNKLHIGSALLYTPNQGIYEDTTKTRKKRSITIPEETMALLKEYRQDYLLLKEANGDRWVDTDYLFVRDNGQPMSPDSITSWLSDFSKRHGLPHINPHAFRHSMASILIAHGTNIVSVSMRLGHAKPSTTTDIYSHFIQEADEQASDCIANALFPTQAKKGTA